MSDRSDALQSGLKKIAADLAARGGPVPYEAPTVFMRRERVHFPFGSRYGDFLALVLGSIPQIDDSRQQEIGGGAVNNYRLQVTPFVKWIMVP
jgi:hypothetical protein